MSLSLHNPIDGYQTANFMLESIFPHHSLSTSCVFSLPSVFSLPNSKLPSKEEETCHCEFQVQPPPPTKKKKKHVPRIQIRSVQIRRGIEFALEQGGLSAEVIRKAFDATEEDFVHLVKRSWVAQPQIASVGSCCLVGAITNDMLYVANLGDSRAVLGRRVSSGRTSNSTAVVAERLSTDHNVGVEEVRKEVEALHPDDAHIVVHTRGVWRIKGIIQVSRSIGDVYLKKPEFHRDPRFQQFGAPVPLKRAVMSAEPSILIRKLRPQDLFLIFASDGLWEQLSDDLAVEIVVKNPRVGIAKRLVRAALGEAARKREMSYDDIKRIKKGVRRYFHDDITVVVVYLDLERGSPNRNCTVDCTSVPIDIFSLNSDEADSTSDTTP